MSSKNYENYISEDRKYINKDTVRSYCNTNETFIPEGVKVRALVLEFPGLGGCSCLGGGIDMGDYKNPFTLRCAELGIVVAYMFPGPWSWGNVGGVRITDLVVDAFMDKYGWMTEDDFSLSVMGGSMGGLCSLIYCADTRHKVNRCVSHCPNYNPIERFGDMPHRPRTLLSAIAGYDMPFEKALEQISPFHRLKDMPKIPYIVLADELDKSFPIEGVEGFVKTMKANGFDVHYIRLDGLQHGELTPEARKEIDDFIVGA